MLHSLVRSRWIVLLVAGACSDSTARVVSDAEIVVMASNGPPGSPGGSSDLVVMNLDGTGRVQLTDDPELEFLPHFSPDATRVLYTKFLQGTYGGMNAVTDVAVYDFTTGRETLLTNRGDVAQPVWSPDGAQIGYFSHVGSKSELWLMDADGGNPRSITSADEVWGDPAWSSDNWILFAVAEQPTGPCFKVRLDKMRPDGSERTKVSDGGPSCTPTRFEQSGDADPGFSPDGATIYTSRGLPKSPPGAPMPADGLIPTERKLVALSSDPWQPGKMERDLSLPSNPDCIEGVPKASPDGTRILEFRTCFNDNNPGGVYLVDLDGTTRTFVTEGFGPDWNPTR